MSLIELRSALYKNQLPKAIQLLESMGADSGKTRELQQQLRKIQRANKLDRFGWFDHKNSFENLRSDLLKLGYETIRNETVDIPYKATSHLTKTRLLYSGSTLLLLGLLAFIAFKALRPTDPCPKHDSDGTFTVVVDKFNKNNQGLLSFFNSSPPEKLITKELDRPDVKAIFHPVKIKNLSNAKEKLSSCNVDMVIYGDLDYGPPMLSFIDYQINEEKYKDYAIPSDFGTSTEQEIQSIFQLKRNEWFDEFNCAINLFLGIIAKQKEELDQANTYFQTLSDCALDPELKATALHLQASMNMELGVDNQETIALYTSILEIDSTDLLALRNVGLLQMENKNFLEAEQKFNAILKQDSSLVEIRFKKAESLYKLENKEKAEKEIIKLKQSQQYKANKDKYEPIVNQKKQIWENNIRNRNTQVDLSSESTSSLINHSIVELNRGNNHGALELLNRVNFILDSQQLTEVDYQTLAKMYVNLGNEEKAKEIAKIAAEHGVKVNARTIKNIDVLQNPRSGFLTTTRQLGEINTINLKKSAGPVIENAIAAWKEGDKDKAKKILDDILKNISSYTFTETELKNMHSIYSRLSATEKAAEVKAYAIKLGYKVS